MSDNKLAAPHHYGIDLLKVISMLLVLVLHILGPGGMLAAVQPGSGQFYVAWFMEILAYCAVNCFAMVSGWLMMGRRFKYRKIVFLWLIVNFYNLVFVLIDIYVRNNPMIFARFLLFFPVTIDEYWYFSAYFCLFFFIPFLNKLVDTLSKRACMALLLTGFMLFCVLKTLLPTDPFHISSGYSAWWLIYMYILGAAMKKHDLFSSVSCKGAFLGYVAMAVLTLLLKTGFEWLMTKDLGYLTDFLAAYGSDRFASYVSPTIVASGVFLMLWCMKLPIHRVFYKPLTFMQPLVFQVYIIHLNYVIWGGYIMDHFGHYASLSVWMLPLAVLATMAVIFVICIFVDYIRSLIFKLLHISQLLDFVSDKLSACYSGSALSAKIDAFCRED